MRLLQRLPDNGGFSLVEHIGNNIPPYAILSHTWGPDDDDEVTFKDVTKGRGKSKPGYRKLTFCSEQAAKDGLAYLWVDTCCIDKTSSAELAEAINSMFKWYEKADRCYAFLSDVPISSPAIETTQEAWEQTFQSSRWFKRGWTLQELLAPRFVDFFSQEGERIGDKNSLLQALHSTTRIPVLALQSSTLSQFTVDERMSWAEGRETKREEDAAYSLLGIFDIHMPLIYGEGRRKAFARLRKEIEGSSSVQPLAKSPPPPSSWTVPFRRDDDFVNRDSLDEVLRICAQPAGRASLVGLGGVGKSQIAIEYAYRVRDRSPTTWVFWVHAGSRASFEEGFRRIAEATKMDGWDDPKMDVLRLVRIWLCDESNGQWAMVVDNADDEAVFFNHVSQSRAARSLDQPAELLSDYLPQSPNGSILITSRSQAVAHKLTGTPSGVIEVKPMRVDDALSLLEKKLDSAAARDKAVELVHALDSMPLALTQAAAFIRQRAPRMSVSRYVDEIRKSDQDRARLLKKDVGDSRRDGRASNSIIATWQISFEHIRKHTPTAARLLSLMSMFDRQRIPEWLLQEQYADEDADADFDDDIHTLSSFSLVNISADGCEFEMHQLVQFSTKKWLELYDELETWRGTYARVMDASYPSGEHENWPVCRALLPHAQALAHSQPKDAKALEAWASVLFKAAWYVSEMGQYSEALELDSAALQVRESVLGVEHPDTLNSLNNLGLVFGWQGQYDEAERLHCRALEARKRVLGDNHPDTLATMNNLALTYTRQGRWEEAEELGLEVMQTFKAKLGDDHPDTLTSIANLALTYTRQGRWEEAEELGLEVVQTRKAKLGDDHPDTLASMGNLAATYRNQGRWKEAEELQLEVMQTRKAKLGDNHPDTLTSIGNLALTYSNQGRWEEAEELELEVVQTRKAKLGDDHPDTLTSMANLAFTWKDTGRHIDAVRLLNDCVQLRRRVLGARHPSYVNSAAALVEWEEARASATSSEKASGT